MKRFIIFYGDHYYPNGGWHDFSHDISFDTLQEAQARIGAHTRDWGHIVDLKLGSIVFEWKTSA
jgi:hypothetical protein